MKKGLTRQWSTARYPQPGRPLAPRLFADELGTPVPAWCSEAWNGELAPPTRLADLDETTWKGFSAADCEQLGATVVRELGRHFPSDKVTPASARLLVPSGCP